MKILYLAPIGTQSSMLAAYTFLDDEVRWLADCGLEMFVFSHPESDRTAVSENGQVRLLPLAPAKSGTGALAAVKAVAMIWKLRRLLPARWWASAFDLWRAARIEQLVADSVREQEIDLIHSNFGWPNGLGGVLAKATTGVPLVATFRGMDLLADQRIAYGRRLKPNFDAAVRVLLKNADLTNHVSQFMRERAIELGADPNSATVVRKGVNCQIFGACAASDSRNAPCPTILTVASLIKRKGIDTIMRALSLLADSHDFSLIIVGVGPELKPLQALSESLSIAHRTSFVGQVTRDRIASFFSACDIFVLGSVLEASGNVLLEAMASERPVICTDSGGPPEYVADGDTGFVVPQDNPAAMAEKLEMLLESPELLKHMGNQGRKRALEHFTHHRMVNEIVATYERALSHSDVSHNSTSDYASMRV